MKVAETAILGEPVLMEVTVTNTGCAAMSYWCGGPDTYPNAEIFRVTLTDADGKGVSEKTLAGKPTALVFFQTACSMCAAEVQDVREIAGRNPGFNIVLVSIDMRPPADKFKSYRKNYAGDTAPIWLDSKLALGRRLKLSATPAVALIDSKGNLAELNIGYSAGEKNTLEQSLKNLK